MEDEGSFSSLLTASIVLIDLSRSAKSVPNKNSEGVLFSVMLFIFLR